MISGDIAKIPLEIYRRQGDSDREVHTSHPSYNAVRRQPNEDQSHYEWRRQMMIHALVWGNAYSVIQRNGRGDAVGLLPLLPDRTTCKRIKGRLIYATEIDHKLEYFDRFDIWHLKGMSFDGLTGLHPVCYARDTIGKILAREDFASKFFKRGGRVGGVLQLPWTKEKSTFDKKEEGFRKAYESDAAFKTVILRDNAKFHAAQASFADTQLVDVGKEDVKQVARILNIPPHKLGAEGNSSYNSLEQENQAYYDNCLSHWLTGIESECWMKMFLPKTRSANRLFFEHTIGALLWADSKTVASIGSNGIRSGWLKPNDVRKWFNLKSDPDGDALLVPSGMVAAGKVDPDPDPDDEEDPDETETETDDGDDVRSAIGKLIEETTLRLHKRLARHTLKAIRHHGFDLDDVAEENRSVAVAMFEQLQIASGSENDLTDNAIRSFLNPLMELPEGDIETLCNELIK